MTKFIFFKSTRMIHFRKWTDRLTRSRVRLSSNINFHCPCSTFNSIEIDSISLGMSLKSFYQQSSFFFKWQEMNWIDSIKWNPPFRLSIRQTVNQLLSTITHFHRRQAVWFRCNRLIKNCNGFGIVLSTKFLFLDNRKWFHLNESKGFHCPVSTWTANQKSNFWKFPPGLIWIKFSLIQSIKFIKIKSKFPSSRKKKRKKFKSYGWLSLIDHPP